MDKLELELPVGVSIDNDGSGDLILGLMNKKVIIIAKPHEFRNLALAIFREALKAEMIWDANWEIRSGKLALVDVTGKPLWFKDKQTAIAALTCGLQEALKMEEQDA